MINTLKNNCTITNNKAQFAGCRGIDVILLRVGSEMTVKKYP